MKTKAAITKQVCFQKNIIFPFLNMFRFSFYSGLFKLVQAMQSLSIYIFFLSFLEPTGMLPFSAYLFYLFLKRYVVDFISEKKQD